MPSFTKCKLCLKNKNESFVSYKDGHLPTTLSGSAGHFCFSTFLQHGHIEECIQLKDVKGPRQVRDQGDRATASRGSHPSTFRLFLCFLPKAGFCSHLLRTSRRLPLRIDPSGDE